MTRPTDKTRGTTALPQSRYSSLRRAAIDDGWDSLQALYEDAQPLPTQVTELQARSVISRNQSPNVPFEQSLNPYQGCEHGCIYCFARPSHAFHDLSPGLDFETQLYAKTNAAKILAAEFAKPGYTPKTLALGMNTDAYQPLEARYGITRQILEVCLEHRHPVSIVTKGRLILRDQDLLQALARDNLIQVMLSLTSMDPALKRSLEPRAAGPQARLQVIRQLRDASIPVGALLAPVIPWINDDQIESLIDAAAAAGAQQIGWVLLRLPLEVAPLFRDWLERHYPQRAAHVMSLIQQAHGGKDYDARFGHRMRGNGPYVALLKQRVLLRALKHGLSVESGRNSLNAQAFRRRPNQSELPL